MNLFPIPNKLMKKILGIVVPGLLWFSPGFAEIKNIGNGLTVNIPNGYHYFEITLKQIVSRFPSIDINDYTNSEFGIGANAKLVILANDKKTIKLVKDITSATGLAKLEEQFWSPLEDLMENSEFIDIITSYGKKKFPKIDWEDVSDEGWQIITFKILGDKRFLKKIDKYIRPLIDKFNSKYQIDKFTGILIADKKTSLINEINQMSIVEIKKLIDEFIKEMSKENPYFKKMKSYDIAKNSKGNLYLYIKNAEVYGLPFTPTTSDGLLTTENDKLFYMASYCYKKCSSTDFLEIIAPTNLYKGFAAKKQSTENTSDIAFQLEQLSKLYKSGALTKDEFNKAKKKLLN